MFPGDVGEARKGPGSERTSPFRPRELPAENGRRRDDAGQLATDETGCFRAGETGHDLDAGYPKRPDNVGARNLVVFALSVAPIRRRQSKAAK